ncbi:MAG: hypothetical protein GXY48_00860 [Methanomicrobiales archaeon]|nr:hypothetical protein [Methanomicrobiales archaeon]
MKKADDEFGRVRSAPQSTIELISLLGRSILSSWKRFLGMILGFAIIGFLINIFLIQYNTVFKGLLNQYFSQFYELFNPVIQFFQVDLALQYNDIIPMAILWMLIGFILVMFTEKGLAGLRTIPRAFTQSGHLILKAGVSAVLIFLFLAGLSFMLGNYLNNLILVLALLITLLYALAAQQNSVLIMAIRLIMSDIRNVKKGVKRNNSTRLISPGYPVSILLGVWVGLLGSFFLLLTGV